MTIESATTDAQIAALNDQARRWHDQMTASRHGQRKWHLTPIATRIHETAQSATQHPTGPFRVRVSEGACGIPTPRTSGVSWC